MKGASDFACDVPFYHSATDIHEHKRCCQPKKVQEVATLSSSRGQ